MLQNFYKFYMTNLQKTGKKKKFFPHHLPKLNGESYSSSSVVSTKKLVKPFKPISPPPYKNNFSFLYSKYY